MYDGAVIDRIEFTAPADLSECSGRSCPENGYSRHSHCASKGCILKDDGEEYSSDAVICVDCKRPVCKSCATVGLDPDEPRCSDCHDEAEAKEEEANLVVNGLLDAARDLKTAGQRLARETDPEKISDAVAALREVQIEASFCASVVAVVRVRAAA